MVVLVYMLVSGSIIRPKLAVPEVPADIVGRNPKAASLRSMRRSSLVACCRRISGEWATAYCMQSWRVHVSGCSWERDAAYSGTRLSRAGWVNDTPLRRYCAAASSGRTRVPARRRTAAAGNIFFIRGCILIFFALSFFHNRAKLYKMLIIRYLPNAKDCLIVKKFYKKCLIF